MREISTDLIEEDLQGLLEPHFESGSLPFLIIVRSFFKDEEWVDYLKYILDVDGIKEDFLRVLSHYTDVIYVGATSGIDLFAIAVPKKGDKIDALEKLETVVDIMEEDLISVFLSESYVGRLQKQFDIFQNPFRTFIEFAAGYAFLKSASVDDIVESVKIALGRADMRRRVKIDDLTRELYHIIDTENVDTYFQPIIDIKERRVYAHEALVRGPSGSPLRSPYLLFKIAHYNNMEIYLDRLVRRGHLKRFSAHIKEHRDARLSINLGPFTPMFIDDVEKDLRSVGIPKENIIWEVSEKTYIDDFTAFARTIDFLVAQGYRVAIDDFGAGTTTFKLIFSINTEIIKVDRSFVENVNEDITKRMFIERLIGCFYKPHTLIVMEGVETRDELNTLLDIGYRYYQGYHLFRPAPYLVSDDDVRIILDGVEYDIVSMKFSGYFLI